MTTQNDHPLDCANESHQGSLAITFLAMEAASSVCIVRDAEMQRITGTLRADIQSAGSDV
jgi:hypothetical protein